MPRMWAVAWALGVAWLALASPGAQAGELEGFVGNWVRTERERDDAARDAMIVRVTEPMSFAFRGFARGVMRTRMVPVERYAIERAADGTQIRNDKGVVLPIDGRPHVTGEDREVIARLSGTGEIEQSWKEGDSHGVAIWRLEPDGRLVISQHVVDAHFEAPLEYSTTYRREP